MPHVSVGVPVFNGERYLEEALVSLLSQTHEDLDVVVSDNASTDRTEEIVRSFAARDQRVKYFRNPTNIGVQNNFNRVFRLCEGEYFKWAAYDDLCAPTFVERCVEVLERDPTAVMAFTRCVDIDQDGKPIGSHGYGVDLTSPKAYERFGRIMCHPGGWTAMYGVIRRSMLARTGLLRNYIGSDRALFAELHLYGRSYELGEELFFSREHPLRSPHVRFTSRVSWEDPKTAAMVRILHLRIAQNLLRIVWRVPLSRRERALCFLQLLKCVVYRSGDLGPVLLREVATALRAALKSPRFSARSTRMFL